MELVYTIHKKPGAMQQCREPSAQIVIIIGHPLHILSFRDVQSLGCLERSLRAGGSTRHVKRGSGGEKLVLVPFVENLRGDRKANAKEAAIGVLWSKSAVNYPDRVGKPAIRCREMAREHCTLSVCLPGYTAHTKAAK